MALANKVQLLLTLYGCSSSAHTVAYCYCINLVDVSYHHCIACALLVTLATVPELLCMISDQHTYPVHVRTYTANNRSQQ
jgi:hypothetical protein